MEECEGRTEQTMRTEGRIKEIKEVGGKEGEWRQVEEEYRKQ